MVLVDFLVIETGSIVDAGALSLTAGAVMSAETSTASDAESMSGGVDVLPGSLPVSLSQAGIGIDVSWGEEGVIFGKEMSCEGLIL